MEGNDANLDTGNVLQGHMLILSQSHICDFFQNYPSFRQILMEPANPRSSYIVQDE